MDKSITINVPDGYEAKWNEETGEIDVVKKNVKPRSWEEYCESRDASEVFYVINPYSEIMQQRYQFEHGGRNLIGSWEEAEAFLAMMQLRALRKSWVGEWEPDWEVRSEKYAIIQEVGKIVVTTSYRVSSPISFPDLDMANDFLGCFKELFETAKILL